MRYDEMVISKDSKASIVDGLLKQALSSARINREVEKHQTAVQPTSCWTWPDPKPPSQALLVCCSRISVVAITGIRIVIKRLETLVQTSSNQLSQLPSIVKQGFVGCRSSNLWCFATLCFKLQCKSRLDVWVSCGFVCLCKEGQNKMNSVQLASDIN